MTTIPPKKLKIATFIDHIYEASIIVTFGNNEQLQEWYKKTNSNGDVNNNWQAFFEKITDTKKRVEYYHLHFEAYGFTTIVHETNHAAFNILHDRGIEMNEHTKEVFAYYQDWLAGKCRDYLEKWTKGTE